MNFLCQAVKGSLYILCVYNNPMTWGVEVPCNLDKICVLA